MAKPRWTEPKLHYLAPDDAKTPCGYWHSEHAGFEWVEVWAMVTCDLCLKWRKAYLKRKAKKDG